MPVAHHSIVIDVPPRRLYDVVFDFERYPEFLPDVKSATVLKTKGRSTEVTFEIEVIKKIRYTLKMTGTPSKRIEWSLVDGDLFKKNEGCWDFKSEGGKTKATYMIDIDFGLFVPGMITRRLIGSSLPAMMNRFKERAEAIGAA